MRWIRRFKHQRSGIETAASRFGGIQWVLSRALYRFSRFDLAAVPASQRVQALRLQVSQWAPFTRAGAYVIWEGASALVWAWDAEEVEAEIRRQGFKPKSVTIVPETLLNEKRVSLSCLQQSLEGFEGQYWLNGSLAASRWWPAAPSAVEWINFQRDAGLPPDVQSTEIPRSIPLKWNDQPWKKSAVLDVRGGEMIGVYQGLVALLVLVLVCSTAWTGSQLYQYRLSRQAQQDRLEELKKQNLPFVEARSAALAAQSRINELQTLHVQPNVLGLLAKVASTLPKDGTYLREWELQGSRLKYQLVSPKKLMLSEYLKQLESMGLFNNIQASQGNDPSMTTVDMEVVTTAEVKFDAPWGTQSAPESQASKVDDLIKSMINKDFTGTAAPPRK